MAEAKHKLDIFRVLDAADLRKRDFYSGLTEEEKREFKSPLVAMRWLSSVASNPLVTMHYVQMTNELVNVDFMALQQQPELQWMLMSRVGAGTTMRHKWINMPKRGRATKIHSVIEQWWPHANELEIEILLNQFTKETFTEFVQSTGMTDKDANELVADFERMNANKQTGRQAV